MGRAGKAANKTGFPGFRECLAMMHKHDPQIQEDGFHALLPHAAEYVPELMIAFQQEQEHGLKCWLLESLAEAKSLEAMPMFIEYLYGDDESLQTWAAYGLYRIDNKDTLRMLYEASQHTFSDVEETRRFRAMLDQVQQWHK